MCVTIAGVLLLADLSAMLSLAGVILIVALGLGAVIFVHELGHFLVAKACGVQCDKFFIGFDIGGYKISRKWGETEYGIGILPLGGYVKMLGQDDDPAHVADEMKKCEVSASSPNAVEVTGPGGERHFVDRRSYLAKSVPQRMAIISAGVIMNVIFAFIFAVVAYGMGVKYMPSIVSETVPGSPAWRAGLQPGDQIVQIGGIENPTFNQLRGGVTLGDMENGIPVIVRRVADDEEISLTLRPEQSGGRGLATIGIISPRTVTLMEGAPAFPGSPAAEAKQIEPPPSGDAANAGFRGGDTIVRVGQTPVRSYRDLAAALAREPSEPLQVTVKRSDNEKSSAASELTFEVPVRPLRSVGLVMKMGPIVAVQADSPAAAAGLKAGDVITAVDGQPLDAPGSTDAWTPDTLPERMRQAALTGNSVTLTVKRGDAEQQISITPEVPTDFHSMLPPRAPVGVPALGIAYRVDSEVAATVADSPAAKAGIEPGDRPIIATIKYPKDKDGKTPDPSVTRLAPAPPSMIARLITAIFGGEKKEPSISDEPNWPAVVDEIQRAPEGSSLELTYERGDQTLKADLEPVTADGLFVADRGFIFMPLEGIRRAETFAQQIQYGRDETVEALTMVYRFLQKIGTQVPVTALGGPVMIAKAAGYSAYEGLPQFLIFLTMLSANLAVLNFLPIPLLDGGHMVFLAYEGLRGRPASEKFVVAMHTVGFVFIVSLMLFVLALDVGVINRDL